MLKAALPPSSILAAANIKQIEGQVQVDLPTFLNSYTAERPQLSEAPKGPQSLPAPDCDCFSCATPPAVENLLRKYATYNRIIPEIGSTLTPHQYFLCGQAVWAYMFKVRNWREYQSVHA